jgi:hypothetical protein
MSVDVTADAPGDWAFHCHLLYHMAAGMMQVVSVQPGVNVQDEHAGHVISQTPALERQRMPSAVTPAENHDSHGEH